MRWPAASDVDRAFRLWAATLRSRHPEITRIGYFGSYARGDWGVGSDLDVVVIVRHADQPFHRRLLDVDDDGLPVPADILVYTEAEFESMKRTHAVSVILYEVFTGGTTMRTMPVRCSGGAFLAVLVFLSACSGGAAGASDAPDDVPGTPDGTPIPVEGWPACPGNPGVTGLETEVEVAVAEATKTISLHADQAAALRCLGRLPGNSRFGVSRGCSDCGTPWRVDLDVPVPVGPDLRASLDAFVAGIEPLLRKIWGLVPEYEIRTRVEYAAGSQGEHGAGYVIDLVSLRGLPVLYDRLTLSMFPDLDPATGLPLPGNWHLKSIQGTTWRDLPALDLDPAHFVPAEKALSAGLGGGVLHSGPSLALWMGRPHWIVTWDCTPVCGVSCCGGTSAVDALDGSGGSGGVWDGFCPQPDQCPNGEVLPPDWWVTKKTPLGPEARSALLAPRDPVPCSFPSCPPIRSDESFAACAEALARVPECEDIPPDLVCCSRVPAQEEASFETGLAAIQSSCGPFDPGQVAALRCLAVRSRGQVTLSNSCFEPFGTPRELDLGVPIAVAPGEDPALAMLRQEGPDLAAAWSLDAAWDLELAVAGSLDTSWQTTVSVAVLGRHGIPIEDNWPHGLTIRLTRPNDRKGKPCPLDRVVLAHADGRVDRRYLGIDPDPAHGIDAVAAGQAGRKAWPLGGEPVSEPVRVLRYGSLAWRVDFAAGYDVAERCAECGTVSVYIDASTGKVLVILANECSPRCFEPPDFEFMI